jgi:hypothetical protein
MGRQQRRPGRQVSVAVALACLVRNLEGSKHPGGDHPPRARVTAPFLEIDNRPGPSCGPTLIAIITVQGRTAWVRRTATSRRRRISVPRRDTRDIGPRRRCSTSWWPSNTSGSGSGGRPRGVRCRPALRPSLRPISGVAYSSTAFCGSSATPARPRSAWRSRAGAADSVRAAGPGGWWRRRRCSWTTSCPSSPLANGCCRCRLHYAACWRHGPREGQKVFTLQTLPPAPEAPRPQVDESSGFSLHAGIAATAPRT